MERFLVSYLTQDLTLKIVHGLFCGGAPRHLRDLARDYNASPSGVSDVIKRLKKAGVLHETKHGNRHLLTLKVTEQERAALLVLFKVQESQRVLMRAERINKHPERVANKLRDMDEMYTFYRSAKSR